jgi:hypothetical protein
MENGTLKSPQKDSEDTQVVKVAAPPYSPKNTVEAPLQNPESIKEKETAMKQEGQKFKRDSWLNKNVQSILAIMVLIFAFIFFKFVLGFDFSKDTQLKEIVILLIGVVSTLVTTVVAYFFGSSQGSSDKSKHIMNGQGK